MLKAVLKLVVRPFGYTAVDSPRGVRVVRQRRDALIYLHDYSGGYDEYRDTQVFHNKRKLDKVWADEGTLSVVATDLEMQGGKVTRGICHGARNGFEVEWLRKRLSADVIGTDISDSAKQFDHMVVWDFHKENPDWAGQFDFVYTNSLDQAMQPDKALAAWSKQLTPTGRIYIEHTMAHSAQGASEMDPFGAHPMCMPYLFFTWGKGLYRLVDIIEGKEKSNNGKAVWLFVLGREPD